jgi:prenyltransferase beta subunit
MRKTRSFFFTIIFSIIFFLSTFQTVFAMEGLTPLVQNDIDTAISLGFSYIANQQNLDGGIRWMEESSSVPVTLRVVLALAASGFSQDYIKSGSELTPLDYIKTYGMDWINQSADEKPSFNVGRAGQLLTAVAAANQNPYAFGDQSFNLIKSINDHYDENSGIFGEASPENVLDQVWAVLGLSAHNAPIPQSAMDWLISVQSNEGYWDDGSSNYLDTTPLTLMALIASGYSDPDSTEIQKGLDFLLTNQGIDGGWQTEWDTSTNASITSLVIQTIQALGAFPNNAPWGNEVKNPVAALLSIQQENGAFGIAYANSYSTADAIIGLSGFSLFNLGYVRQINQGFQYILSSQQPDGGWENVGLTIDVILALQAAGWDPNSIIQGENTPIDFIMQNYPSYVESGPDAIGKTILGVVASGGDPTHFNDTDLIEMLNKTYDESNKAFGDPDNTWHQSLAILGLFAAGEDIPLGAIETLKNIQQSDGGWDYTVGAFGSWPDHTSIAIQALLAAGISAADPIIKNGFEFIKTHQKMDGDWGDSSTSSYAIMAFNALDEPVYSSQIVPQNALLSFQKNDGSFYFNNDYPDSSMMATASALTALLGGNYILEKMNYDTSRAGLIIDPGDGNCTTACISFSSDSISGLSMLIESEIDFSTTDDGFMESMMGISNPQGGSMYWAYWVWDGREWQFNQTGANGSSVLKGTIETWVFSSWETFPSPPPTGIPSFREICPSTSMMSYQAHPYLSYVDMVSLFGVGEKQNELPIAIINDNNDSAEDSDEETIQLKPEISPETSKTPVPISDITASALNVGEPETKANSIIPIIIIAFVGAMAILFIFVTLFKEKK